MTTLFGRQNQIFWTINGNTRKVFFSICAINAQFSSEKRFYINEFTSIDTATVIIDFIIQKSKRFINQKKNVLKGLQDILFRLETSDI